MSEAELQDAVIECARLLGWRCAHFRPAQTGKGWRTPMIGDTGFPDVVLARDGRILFLELKAAGKKPRPEQTAWLEALACDCEGRPCPHPGVLVVQPEHWLSGEVEELLR